MEVFAAWKGELRQKKAAAAKAKAKAKAFQKRLELAQANARAGKKLTPAQLEAMNQEGDRQLAEQQAYYRQRDEMRRERQAAEQELGLWSWQLEDDGTGQAEPGRVFAPKGSVGRDISQEDYQQLLLTIRERKRQAAQAKKDKGE